MTFIPEHSQTCRSRGGENCDCHLSNELLAIPDFLRNQDNLAAEKASKLEQNSGYECVNATGCTNRQEPGCGLRGCKDRKDSQLEQNTGEDLLPCPLCGHDQDDFAGMIDGAFATCSDGTYSINCSKCNTTGPAGKSMVEAVEQWNTRMTTKQDK